MNVERSTDGGLTAWFAPVEVELLRLATSQLVDLLSGANDDNDLAISDPAIRRMLPDAYSDDPEAAKEFRRFTAGGLLESKIENAALVRDALANVQGVDDLLPSQTESPRTGDTDSHELVVIDEPAVLSWLRALTDLRLTLAERLQMSPDGEIQLDGEEAEFLNDLYDWLGMVQESFIYAIDV
ncbi:hypothetical protein GCM10022381_04710 [Leifsonia kafniensis]|uniref:DUF2017 domain-containing protein n=1 Tax=Leifsonia kafniensis TaxID=475957 RepID=A0ABP7K3K8_9MICO